MVTYKKAWEYFKCEEDLLRVVISNSCDEVIKSMKSRFGKDLDGFNTDGTIKKSELDIYNKSENLVYKELDYAKDLLQKGKPLNQIGTAVKSKFLNYSLELEDIIDINYFLNKYSCTIEEFNYALDLLDIKNKKCFTLTYGLFCNKLTPYAISKQEGFSIVEITNKVNETINELYEIIEKIKLDNQKVEVVNIKKENDDKIVKIKVKKEKIISPKVIEDEPYVLPKSNKSNFNGSISSGSPSNTTASSAFKRPPFHLGSGKLISSNNSKIPDKKIDIEERKVVEEVKLNAIIEQEVLVVGITQSSIPVIGNSLEILEEKINKLNISELDKIILYNKFKNINTKKVDDYIAEILQVDKERILTCYINYIDIFENPELIITEILSQSKQYLEAIFVSSYYKKLLLDKTLEEKTNIYINLINYANTIEEINKEFILNKV